MTPPKKRARVAEFSAESPKTEEEAERHLQAALKASVQRVTCPLCHVEWPESEIVRHASSCGTESASKEVEKQWKTILPGLSNTHNRRIPFFKVLDGMPLAVDAFRYGAIEGCTAYFLTHFHSDHYAGLSSTWKHGPIYCTPATSRLVHAKLRVDKMWLRPIALDVRTLIPDSGGVYVTCIDANHCPGSCLFLFEGPLTAHILPSSIRNPHIGTSRVFRYLHCGDFRACPAHKTHPALQLGILDAIYLDTTYLDPRYCFPPQAQVVQACIDLVVTPHAQPHGVTLMSTWLKQPQVRSQPLVVVGSYSIGKERLFLALAKALDSCIYCADARKYETYALLDDPTLQSRLTKDPMSARVHVVTLNALSLDTLRAYTETFVRRGMSISHTIAIRPTGWTFSGRSLSPKKSIDDLAKECVPPTFTYKQLEPQRQSTHAVRIYAVPYSEHSSFYELMALMVSLPHRRIIPTVSAGNQARRQAMRSWTDIWTAASTQQHVHIAPRSEDYW